MPKVKAPPPVFSRKAQLKFLKAVAIFVTSCGPEMRIELNGMLREIDDMHKERNTYRATFTGQKPKPGQLAMTVNAECEVEVYAQTKDRWAARYWPSKTALAGITAGTREGIQFAVEAAFTTKQIDWVGFTPEGAPYVQPESLPGTEDDK